MMNTKVITVIENRTQLELVLRIGPHHSEHLATIVSGGEHKMELDIHWTYQEFSLEPAMAGHGMRKVFLSSDDFCDSERLVVTISEGKLKLETVMRGQSNEVDRRPVLANWRSLFTWPKNNWRFWL